MSPSPCLSLSLSLLRHGVQQRLAAAAEQIFELFEKALAEYEDEFTRSLQEETVFRRHVHTEVSAGVQQGAVRKDEVEPECHHIKEEQVEPWTNEDEDVTEFNFSPVIVKDEDRPELHQSLTEDNRDDCGGPEADGHLVPVSPEAAEDVSATEDSEDDWRTSRKRAGLKKRKTHVSVAEKPFVCTECGKGFKLRDHLKAHERIHTGEKPFGCSVCGRRFNQKSNLRRHAVTHTGEKPFVCSVCGNRFRLKDSLKSHLKIHTGEKPFGCSICGKTFKQKEYLMEHTVVHTGEKRFGCSVCHRSFTWRHQIRSHQCVRDLSLLHQSLTEDSREDFGGPEPAGNSGPDGHLGPVSPEASGAFAAENLSGSTDGEDDQRTSRRRADLKKLKPNVSAAEKPFVCTECGKGFKVRAHLKAHERIHTGEKPFGCSVCGKRFNQKSNLRRHAVTHTGEKPFVCSVCGNRFRLKDSLKSHLKIHTGEKPFGCSICGKTFKQKEYLTKHMIVHTDGDGTRGAEPPTSS
ncbi:gastrula zinc finger protein XlCGF57.1-like [Solea solea]|uniref:gastrula zinc finger protein XlCGF57.1-like n=1 Tax=Solea solea TaxID=90069 RepID=UPI00272A5C0A|nr:gastrula zinc finger protein XlCGF57.1-like [Solea solea]